MNSDMSQQLQQQIQDAYAKNIPLNIIGGNSKSFYGRPVSGQTLDVSRHSGIINYEPTELVITVRAGTLLSEIESTLKQHGQMLAFEPPAFAASATIGGTIACNFSGPRRAYSGAARDFVLGCKIINGKGEILSFGGEVMKNVAGYDVSRLMAGAMGTLGVLLEVSLKVLPAPEIEITQTINCTSDDALNKLHQWSQTPLPVSASSYHNSTLHVRLSGTKRAVTAAIEIIGGEQMPQADHYWQSIREQQHPFFTTQQPLWRLSLPSDIESLPLSGDTLIEWGGALRWLKSDTSAEQIHKTMTAIDGHATLFRHQQQGMFQPLNQGMMHIHKNIKQAFDPGNILNPGKLYAEL